jgi:hypothetical protein
MLCRRTHVHKQQTMFRLLDMVDPAELEDFWGNVDPVPDALGCWV